MVVVIHANVSFIQSTEGLLFKIGTHITGSMTICVPLFFMVSGALLLNLEQSASLRNLFEYRVKKIFVPFFYLECYLFIDTDDFGEGREINRNFFFNYQRTGILSVLVHIYPVGYIFVVAIFI